MPVWLGGSTLVTLAGRQAGFSPMGLAGFLVGRFRYHEGENLEEDYPVNIAQILKAKGRAVTTARPDATLLDISVKLALKRIGAIVIVGDNGELIGMLSERDVIRAIAEHGEKALKMVVADFMTRTVVSCQETNTLEEIMGMMNQGRFRHVPVIEDEALVGLISMGDLVKNHIAEVEMEVTAMRDYFVTG